MAKFELNPMMVTKEFLCLFGGLQQSSLINFKHCYRNNYFFYDYMFDILNMSITLDINVLELKKNDENKGL